MYKTLLQAIGNTPLIKINFAFPATMLAKLEYLNPGGSIKDRSALYMIEEAERTGKLKSGGTIIDASSGNQGIATAMIGAIKGYQVIISVSEKISQEKLNTLRAYGAEVVINPSTATLDDPKSYHSKAVALHKQIPNSFMPNQYFNISNAHAHYHLLGPEIWEQTNGTITHFFAAAGTGGHVSGAGRYLKEKNPEIKIIALDSINSWRATKGNPKPYQVEGMGIDFDSPVLQKEIIDEILEVHDKDALNMLKILAHQHGLLVGPSSGAIAYAAYQYALDLKETDVCVMIFGDSGRAYLTKKFYAKENNTHPMLQNKPLAKETPII
ncbi:MAG: cysteine synthase family protein [Candidatus Babeliales bacterium]